MDGQENRIAKKRGRPATGRGQTVGVRMLPVDLAHLDAFIAAQPDPKPSRPEAIRYLLRDHLIGLGLIPHREDPEGGN